MTSTDKTIIQYDGPKLYFFGSAECDQFFIDEDRFESKRPFELTKYFISDHLFIHSVACGGLHTILLTTIGKIYSLGCNDDGALGREGTPQEPGLVPLDYPIDMISAGDSHSIACNSTNSIIYYWGVYRNTLKGNITKSTSPHIIGQSEFKKKKINKILSGANHSLVLCEGRVYAWGDADTGVIGRMPSSRRKFEHGLRIESMAHNVVDIYTGGYHSFLKKITSKKTGATTIFAWGLNNYGQLGTGDNKDTHIPREIVEFRNKDFINITGGEHHTIALTTEKDMYVFGKNDSGQLGLGEDYKQPVRVDKKDEIKEHSVNSTTEDNKKDSNLHKMIDENQPTIVPEDKVSLEKNGEIIQKNELADSEANKLTEEQLLEEMREKLKKTFKFVNVPTLVKIDIKIKQIYSGTNFNYAISDSDDNDVYSWGMGDNYVLGTRDEDVVYEPTLIPAGFFKNEKVITFGLGAQHVVALTLADKNIERPTLETNVFIKNEEPKTAKKSTVKSVKLETPSVKDFKLDQEEVKEIKENVFEDKKEETKSINKDGQIGQKEEEKGEDNKKYEDIKDSKSKKESKKSITKSVSKKKNEKKEDTNNEHDKINIAIKLAEKKTKISVSVKRKADDEKELNSNISGKKFKKNSK